MQNANADDLKKEAPPQRRTFQFGLSRRSMLPAVAGLIISILIGLVIHASYRNENKYYLQFEAGAVEIWQGTFSPGGKKRILIMPGVQKPAQIKAVYTKEAVFPLAFHFYVSKTDRRNMKVCIFAVGARNLTTSLGSKLPVGIPEPEIWERLIRKEQRPRPKECSACFRPY